MDGRVMRLLRQAGLFWRVWEDSMALITVKSWDQRKSLCNSHIFAHRESFVSKSCMKSDGRSEVKAILVQSQRSYRRKELVVENIPTVSRNKILQFFYHRLQTPLIHFLHHPPLCLLASCWLMGQGGATSWTSRLLIAKPRKRQTTSWQTGSM